METNNLKIRITFTEDLLGTASKNPDIHREFIASKAPDALSMEEEVEAIGAEAMKEVHSNGGAGRCADLWCAAMA